MEGADDYDVERRIERTGIRKRRCACGRRHGDRLKKVGCLLESLMTYRHYRMLPKRYPASGEFLVSYPYLRGFLTLHTLVPPI